MPTTETVTVTVTVNFIQLLIIIVDILINGLEILCDQQQNLTTTSALIIKQHIFMY